MLGRGAHPFPFFAIIDINLQPGYPISIFWTPGKESNDSASQPRPALARSRGAGQSLVNTS